MPTITVDGKQYEVEAGTNLLQAILSQSLDLPYFCWHPSLGSVGACRQCAIIQYQDEEDTRGRLTMACMTNVADDMLLSVEAAHAKDFRATVIEWLMENHPHDCPVCEEGGECHLQDMTVMTGHSVRRYRENKRTWENQDLGPFIGHEMNRCITCYRCVRFYQDYAGGSDLTAFGSRSRMYFGRLEDGTLESEFAGNLVEVCPTGVFTDRPFAQKYTRKWDLQSAASVCPGCSVGCNTFASERYGELRRLHNRYHHDVNRYFLCDRGRFGSHFVNSPARIKHAGVKAEDGVFEYGDAKEAVAQAAALVKGGNVVGIGSPRASLEANHALRQLVGDDNFCRGLGEAERESTDQACSILMRGGFNVPTVSEVEDADAIFVVGEDISNTAARVALAVRQASRNVSFDMAGDAGIPLWQDAGVRGHAQHHRNPLYIAASQSTRLDDVAQAIHNDLPAGIASVAVEVSQAIESGQVEGEGFARQVAKDLSQAEHPLLITGTSMDPSVLNATAKIAWALKASGKQPSLLIVGKEANSFNAVVTCEGLTIANALQRVAEGAHLVVLENDLTRRVGKEQLESALAGSGKLICLDSLVNDWVDQADIVFPAATYAEQTGSFVNYETRAQRFYQVFEPSDDIQPSWRWLSAIASQVGLIDASWQTIDALTESALDALPVISANLSDLAPTGTYRIAGEHRIPRQSHRYSGRTAMRADVSVHEPKAAQDSETPFSYSMEGVNTGDQAGAVIPYSWSPGWNSNQSIFKFQSEVAGDLKGQSGGQRLFSVPSEPDTSLDSEFSYDVEIQEPSENGGLQAFASYCVFGSDELALRSWPIAKRSSGPFVRLHPDDAQALGVDASGGVHVSGLDDGHAVILDERVKPGSVGISVGLNGKNFLSQPHVELTAIADFQPRPMGEDQVIAKS